MAYWIFVLMLAGIPYGSPVVTTSKLNCFDAANTAIHKYVTDHPGASANELSFTCNGAEGYNNMVTIPTNQVFHPNYFLQPDGYYYLQPQSSYTSSLNGSEIVHPNVFNSPNDPYTERK